jgi:hypothetical protein
MVYATVKDHILSKADQHTIIVTSSDSVMAKCTYNISKTGIVFFSFTLQIGHSCSFIIFKRKKIITSLISHVSKHFLEK